jgi:hypothetical protein
VTWILVYNRTSDSLPVGDGRLVTAREFTYADDEESVVAAALAAGTLVEKTISFDPEGSPEGIDPEAYAAAAEVIVRNGGEWERPSPPVTDLTLEELNDLFRSGRLAQPDSGWRDLSAVFEASPGQILLRRIGSYVEVKLNPADEPWPDNTDFGAPANAYQPPYEGDGKPGGVLPVGLRPTGLTHIFGSWLPGDVLGPWFLFKPDGRLQITTLGINGYIDSSSDGQPQATGGWITEDPWPATLPGEMVTPPALLDGNGISSLDEPSTGWRDVSKTLNASTPEKTIFVRRLGNAVSLLVNPYMVPLTSDDLQGYSIPLGFRPTVDMPEDLGGAASYLYGSFGTHLGDDGGYYPPGGGDGEVIAINHEGKFVGQSATFVGMGRFDYVTEDPWPAPLPGVKITDAKSGYNGPAGASDGSSERDSGWYTANAGSAFTQYDKVSIRRKGSLVMFSMDGDFSGVTADGYLDPAIPAGFRNAETPDGDPTPVEFSFWNNDGGGLCTWRIWGYEGGIMCLGPYGGIPPTGGINATWVTDDEWPESVHEDWTAVPS